MTDDLDSPDTSNHRKQVELIPTGGEAKFWPTETREHSVLERICEPLLRKHPMGMRHLWLGDSGMGKTIANMLLIAWIRRRKLVQLTLTVDDKNAHEVQYEGGLLRTNPSELRSKPPTGDEKSRADHVVFRGIANTRRPGPDVDNLIFDTAEMSWSVVREHSTQVLLNIDELADATNGHQGWRDTTVAQTYRKGRAVGISVLATTQMPQLLPREAFGLSETIGIFRMSARELDYLAKYRVIEPSEVDSIEALEVGEFRLFQKSQPLDPKVYKFEL
jgi:hypothetical protein